MQAATEQAHLGDLALRGRRVSGGERQPTWAFKGLEKDNIRTRRVDRTLTGSKLCCGKWTDISSSNTQSF